MLKRTEMMPGVKIRFRNSFKLPAMGSPTGDALTAPIDTQQFGSGNSTNALPKTAQPGTTVSPAFGYGDVATVTSKVRNLPNVGKQIRLEDSVGNAGWIYWAFVYLNADKI
jgi:hypothetical protein